MMYTILLYALAIAMLIVCVAVVYFLREKQWTMVRDAVDDLAKDRQKDARLRASERIRSRRVKADRNIWGVTVSPITSMLGLDVSTELRTRR